MNDEKLTGISCVSCVFCMIGIMATMWGGLWLVWEAGSFVAGVRIDRDRLREVEKRLDKVEAELWDLKHGLKTP